MLEWLRCGIYCLFLFVFGTACSGGTTATTDSGNVGTIVIKPLPPSNNIFPDFEVYFPNYDSDNSDSAALIRTAVSDASDIQDGSIVFTDILTRIEQIGEYRSNFQRMGEEVAAAISAAGLIEVSNDPITISLPEESPNLTDHYWDVEISLDTNDSSSIRYFFLNRANGTVWSTYVASFDDSGRPVRGLFAYANPNLLVEEADLGLRVFELAFDLTDSSHYLIVLRCYKYDQGLGAHVAVQIHRQCSSDGTCITEVAEIASVSPVRGFTAERSVRFERVRDRAEICYSSMPHGTGSAEPGTTVWLANRYATSGTEGTCVLPEPYWGGHAFMEDDLLYRYADTEPHGGTAAVLYGDGFSRDSWNVLSLSLIDSWLSAAGF